MENSERKSGTGTGTGTGTGLGTGTGTGTGTGMGMGKKRGRGRKRTKERPKIDDQKKFFIDYSSDQKGHQALVKILNEVNDKRFGKEVSIKDVFDYLIKGVSQKDIEKIQELSYEEMDKVQVLLEKHNEKNSTNLSLGEFLVKQLKIN
jgi:hypothetical protein